MGPLGLIDLDRPPLSLAEPLIRTAEEYLRVPSGICADAPLKLTDEQIEVLWAWYAVTPNGRKFVFNRKLILRMAKGWAKSPIGAVDVFSQLTGDVIPDGLDANRRPVGRPHPRPWIQVAANALDQTDNLYKQFHDMLKDSPAIDDFRLDLGVTRTTTPAGGLVEPVTSEAGTREGQPISGAVLEETHLYRPSNGGVAMADTIHRNATKFNARVIELTNAYPPGAGTTAQRSEDAVARGRGSGVLLVKREAEPPANDEQMRDAAWVRAQLTYVYGSSSTDRGGWVDLDRITQDIVEAPDDRLSQQRRFFFNQVVAPEEHALDLVRWGILANGDARLVQGDVIAIGFDGSDSADATALYACRWPDWTLFEINVWEPPLDDQGRRAGAWRAPRAEILAKVRETCETYRVVRGYFDDAGWQSEIDQLNGELGNAVLRFPHRVDQRIGPACERWQTMIDEGTLRHDGMPTLARHAANARKVLIGRQDNPDKDAPKWWRPARRVESLPIDALSAAISAVHALGDAAAHGETTIDDGPQVLDGPLMA